MKASIRPFFNLFVRHGIQHELHLAVVTFSKRFDMIESALRITFGEDIASKIVVRGDNTTGRWEYIGAGVKTGKQAHMASAGRDSSQYYVDIQPLP